MYLPKAIEILQTFSSVDWRECGDFLKGRMRADHDCIILYDQIKKKKDTLFRYDEYQPIIKAQFFDHITAKSFTNLLAKLVKVMEEYLAFDQLIQDPITAQLSVLRSLNSRGLYKLFDQKAASLEKELLDENRIDLNDELHLMQLNHMRFFSNNPIKNRIGGQLLCDLGQSSKYYNHQYSQLIQATSIHLQEITKEKNKEIVEKSPKANASKVIGQLYNLKKAPKESTFKQLSSAIHSPSLKINTELKTITLEFLIHNAHQRIKAGELSIVTDLLSLYEYGFETGLLLTNNTLTENKLINVIVVACANEQFDRAEELLKNHKHLLLAETQRETIVICKALIKFYGRHYGDLIESIRDESLSSTPQEIRRRWMMLCASYKTLGSDINYMKGLIKNYNSYFYNNKSKMSNSGFKGSLNLSRGVTMLLNSASKLELEEFLGSCDHLIFKTWLLKEVEIL